MSSFNNENMLSLTVQHRLAGVRGRISRAEQSVFKQKSGIPKSPHI